MPIYQQLSFQKQGRICYLTLDPNGEGHALTEVLVAELKDAIRSIGEDEQVKVVILKSNGKVFSAGLDKGYVSHMRGFTFAQHVADAMAISELVLDIYRSTRMIIAQVEGDAIGRGCAILAACDFVFAIPESCMGFDEVRYGMVPATAMNILIRKLGEGRAKELLLTGNLVSASRASSLGLITDVVNQADIEATVWGFAEKLCNDTSSASLQMTKKMIADIQSMPLPQAAQFAAKMSAYAQGTPDAAKGLEALEKGEHPTWT